jgi:rhamnulokinase
MAHKFLAVDLGAESGRCLVGTLAGGRLETEIVHRFPTQGLVILGTRQWDITRIHEEIVRGLSFAVRKHGSDFAGLAIDTWGVDFGLIDEHGTLLGNPVHYRDHRNDGMASLAESRVGGAAELYRRTGIVSLPFNTLFQVLALAEAKAPTLAIADKLLFVGSLLGYWLTGKATCEYTIASTAGMLKAGTREWDTALLKLLGIPIHFLPEVSAPESVIGPVSAEICEATGLQAGTPLICGAVHDTASAVVAVPVTSSGQEWAYLSSGTWSLLGAELAQLHISDASLAARFTNEGGVGGTIRFLKNIIGLWIIQECRRAWVAGQQGDETGLDYATLVAEAQKAEAFRSVVNLEDGRLLAPESMPDMLATLCREGNQPVPRTRGEYMRCAMESLAICYRRNLRHMDAVLGRRTQRLHIIGGGSQNVVLNQMTADACGIPVHAGPVEATAMGNILVQAIATGAVKDLSEARGIIAASSSITVHEPHDRAAWDAASNRIVTKGD